MIEAQSFVLVFFFLNHHLTHHNIYFCLKVAFIDSDETTFIPSPVCYEYAATVHHKPSFSSFSDLFSVTVRNALYMAVVPQALETHRAWFGSWRHHCLAA